MTAGRIMVLILVAVLVAAVLFLPSAGQQREALQRSAPRLDLEPYFSSLLERQPDHELAIRELIRIRRLKGDGGGEIELRERLLQRRGDDEDNWRALRELYELEGDEEKEVDILRRLVKRFPERADFRLRLVQLLERGGRTEDLDVHRRWLEERGYRRDADTLGAPVAAEWVPPGQRARTLAAAGEMAAAIEAYGEHLARHPEDFAARRATAELLLAVGRPMEAAEHLERILSRRDDPAARSSLLQIYRGLNRTDLMLPHLPDGTERAEVLLAYGRVEEAREIFRRRGDWDRLLDLAEGLGLDDEEIACREKLPMTDENRRRLGALYAWHGEYAKALAHYEALRDPRVIDVHLRLGDLPGAIRAARTLNVPERLGQLLLWSGDLEGAIAEFRRTPGMERELISLLLQAGRLEEAVSTIDSLRADPHERAEMYLYAQRPDRAVPLLSSVSPDARDARRIEKMAGEVDAATSDRLYGLLLEIRPRDPGYLRARARLADELNRPEDALEALRKLRDVRPDDPWVLAQLGLRLRDPKLLERAVDLGSTDAVVLRTLADLAAAEGRKGAAIEHYRRYHRIHQGDASSHLMLAELSEDPADFLRALELVPEDDLATRAHIFTRLGRLDQAAILYRRSGDTASLFRTLVAANRLEDAYALNMPPRERGLLAYRLERYEEAAALLRKADTRDPEVRRALADSLLRQERWQEAQEYAIGDQERDIRGRYGAEGAAWYRRTEAPGDFLSAWGLAHRFHVSQPGRLRFELSRWQLSGGVPALEEDQTVEVVVGELQYSHRFQSGLRGAAGVAVWESDVDQHSPSWIFEVDRKWPAFFLGGRAELFAPWVDAVETAAFGGWRHRADVRLSGSPGPRLFLSSGAEALAYHLADDRGTEAPADFGHERKFRARAEYRLWSGEGVAGNYFLDSRLLDETFIETHLALAIQHDAWNFRGDPAVLAYIPLLPAMRLTSIGPSVGYATETWGVRAAAFVGMDSERDLEFGRARGAFLNAMHTFVGRWNLASALEYLSERPDVFGGRTWSLSFGLNHEF
ncbi:MAG: tetratricopeptide repeat protein [Planctomycetes bacterium]|nr:tetratricopeptide repeat protein [Planctomycetota bacterium]